MDNDEPRVLTAGDTEQWTIGFDDFPADQYALTVRLSGASVTSVTGSAFGNFFDVVLPASQSAALAPGVYSIAYLLTSGSNRFTARTRNVTVVPDPAATTAGSAVTHAERSYALICSLLEGRFDASNQTEVYTIAGRSVTLIPVHELLVLKAYYGREIKRLRDGDNGAEGSSIKIKFNPTGGPNFGGGSFGFPV